MTAPAPLALSDEEMDAVLRAAAPIAPELRDAFLVGVADALAKCAAERRGPGTLYCIVRDLQRRFLA